MIEIILALLVGIWIGKTVTNAINQFTFREILKDLKVTQQDLEQLTQVGPEQTPQVEVRIEQHQGHLYAYRADNDQFLAQGTDQDSVIRELNNNLKPYRVIVKNG